MAKVNAGITMSVDGFIAGPNDGPGKGLGDAGERLHHWVFGGPWAYGDGSLPAPRGEDATWLAEVTGRLGAVVTGRNTYDAVHGWGGSSPWGVPVFVVTHRTEDEAAGEDFTFVAGVDQAVSRAVEAAGDRYVHVMGGAQVIRQALDADLVDELTIIIAPLILGSGKRLFDGFTRDVELEQAGVRQSEFATFVDYVVKR
jgi:dihydrofolate reductase